ncbi:MAG: hypothetical protein INR71_09675 [Terriglobus roseus]|nr:hypothetical protein [Terriglobus roseus]
MPPPHVTGRTRPTKVKKLQYAQKRKRDDVQVEALESAIQSLVSQWTSSSHGGFAMSN